jgi:hypothetical protein
VNTKSNGIAKPTYLPIQTHENPSLWTMMDANVQSSKKSKLTPTHRRLKAILASYSRYLSHLLFGILVYSILNGNVLDQLCFQPPTLDKLPDTEKVIGKAVFSVLAPWWPSQESDRSQLWSVKSDLGVYT